MNDPQAGSLRHAKCRALFAHRWFSRRHVGTKRIEFRDDGAEGLELDGDLGVKFSGAHRSTRARFSISLMNGLGGSDGTPNQTCE